LQSRARQVAGTTAAEIVDARELPIQADRAHEGCAGDLVVAEIVDLDSHHGRQNGLLTSRHRSVRESPISCNSKSLSVARNARSLILAFHCLSSAVHRLSDAEASERPLFAFVFIQVAAFPVK
jgi:hypothetical protein